MASTLINQLQMPNSVVNTINQIKGMFNGMTPQAAHARLMQSNPAYASFVQANAGKTAQEIAQSYGIDWGKIAPFI